MELTIEEYCCQLHNGQWFTFSNPKNKSLSTLKLTEYGKEKGYNLPTQKEYDDWKREKEEQAEKQKIIARRKAEYGRPELQIENIIEAINDGIDPAQALQNEADRIKSIKEKYPKGE